MEGAAKAVAPCAGAVTEPRLPGDDAAVPRARAPVDPQRGAYGRDEATPPLAARVARPLLAAIKDLDPGEAGCAVVAAAFPDNGPGVSTRSSLGFE